MSRIKESRHTSTSHDCHTSTSHDINESCHCVISTYGVATISRLLKIIGLLCKRALQKRRYSAKETYDFKKPTNHSHPMTLLHLHSHWCHFNMSYPGTSLNLLSLRIPWTHISNLTGPHERVTSHINKSCQISKIMYYFISRYFRTFLLLAGLAPSPSGSLQFLSQPSLTQKEMGCGLGEREGRRE